MCVGARVASVLFVLKQRFLTIDVATLIQFIDFWLNENQRNLKKSLHILRNKKD